jgi:invasion protein IalB
VGVKLKVDGKNIPINDFVESILSGCIVGAVTTLHGIDEDWQKIEIEIQRQPSQ